MIDGNEPWPKHTYERNMLLGKQEMVKWPSGLRRQLKALVRKGVGSNPTAVILGSPLVCELAPRGPGALRPVGALAQLVERRSHNPKVVSSILTGPSFCASVRPPQCLSGLCLGSAQRATLRVRDSIVVSISACHADDPGSIPGRGAFWVPETCRGVWVSLCWVCQYRPGRVV